MTNVLRDGMRLPGISASGTENYILHVSDSTSYISNLRRASGTGKPFFVYMLVPPPGVDYCAFSFDSNGEN